MSLGSASELEYFSILIGDLSLLKKSDTKKLERMLPKSNACSAASSQAFPFEKV